MKTLGHSYNTEQDEVSAKQLEYIRIAAVIMATIVLIFCLICIIIIKRNIRVGFSLITVGLITVINLGFIIN